MCTPGVTLLLGFSGLSVDAMELSVSIAGSGTIECMSVVKDGDIWARSSTSVQLKEIRTFSELRFRALIDKAQAAVEQ